MYKKLLLPLVLGVFFISACSPATTEISPEEKRNNFDLCVLNYLERNSSQIESIREFYQQRAPIACKDELE